MTKQRLHHFDVIKGIAILIVVMGHVMIFGIHDIDKAFIFKLTGKLHMPLFFFISGYFSYKLIEHKIIKPNIISRFKQLIIPFICVSTLWLYYFPHSEIESPLNSTWQGLYTDQWKNGYWFTLCLFELILIYYILTPIFNQIKNTLWQVTIILAIYLSIGIYTRIGNYNINSYLSLFLVFEYMPIFFIGIYSKKYNDLFNRIITNNISISISLIIGSLLIYYLCYFWEFPQIPFIFIEVIRSISHIAVIIVAFAVIKPWCEKEFAAENPSKIITGLQYIGKESLSIYLLHYFFLFPMTSLRQPMIDMGLGFVPLFVVSLFTSIAVIFITLGVSHIISKSKLLSTMLLGKI